MIDHNRTRKLGKNVSAYLETSIRLSQQGQLADTGRWSKTDWDLGSSQGVISKIDTWLISRGVYSEVIPLCSARMKQTVRMNLTGNKHWFISVDP